mgnify:CR=1 FL=1
MSGGGALGHLVVLDASDGIAGQYCGRLLSDFGADVFLLESDGGTPTRRMGPFGKADGQSLLFRHLNLGKRSVVFDSTDEGRLAALAARADIALLAPGIDHAALRTVNPRLVTCPVSDFGEEGPRRDWKAGELIHQALSGVMYRNGDPQREPLYGCGHRAYYVSGIAAYIAVLSAIFARARTGRGQHCSIDVAESAASMTYALATQYNYNGVQERRTTPSNLPSAVLRCKDGWVSVFIYAYRWKEACAALDVGHLASDPGYATAEDRMLRWKEIVATFQASVEDIPADTVVEKLQALGCVAGKAVRPSELPRHPHLLARGYWEEVDTPDGRQTVLGPPFRMEKTPRVLPSQQATRRVRAAS